MHRTALPPSIENRPLPSITRPVSAASEGSCNMYTVSVKIMSAPSFNVRSNIKATSRAVCVFMFVNVPVVDLQSSS